MLKHGVLRKKIKDALLSVLPITLVVLVMSLTVTPLPNYLFISFFVGAVFMIVGTGLFSLGAEGSMSRIGEYVGSEMAKSRKIWLVILLAVFVGFIVTASEPDLQVLASYTPSIDTTLFIVAVSAGVGVFLAIAILRIIFNVKIKYILLVSYAIVFILALFAPTDFWPVAFDAGGATTGVMSVPFIIAIGSGITAISSRNAGDNDNFGITAICSVGPVIALLLLGIINGADMSEYTSETLKAFEDSRQMGLSFFSAIPGYMFEVAKGLLPIVLFFIVYQWIMSPIGKRELKHIIAGAVISYVGIVFFLTGVNLGFMPVGSYLGDFIGNSKFYWLIVPTGMLLGYFIVAAEPAVKVLETQVETATSGTIPPKALSRSLAIGVSLAAGIAMLRAVTGIPIMWFIATCYAVAIIISFFVPGVFTSIAFDAGGVASGAMAAGFLLPLAVGACQARGGNIMEDAFGVIALVAAAPAITIQILGLTYKIQHARAQRAKKNIQTVDTEIFEFSCIKEEN